MALDASVQSTGSKQGARYYMSVKFATQGKLKGSALTNSIPFQGVHYRAAEPEHDPHSGLSTPQADLKPITIIREVDSASPQLLHACSTGEPFESLVLSFPKIGAGGKSGKPNTIELVNGYIHKISLSSAIKGKRSESIILVYNGLRINGATASNTGGAETRWWRDTW